MKEKKKKNKKQQLTIFMIGMFIFLCFILSILYSLGMKQLTYHNVYKNISELSEQTATQLSMSIKNQMKFLDLIVDFINGGYAKTEDEIFKRFEPDLTSYHFTRLVILDSKGNGKTSDGYTVKNYPNIEEFFAQETTYLSENRPSTVSENQVNIYSKVFDWHGEKKVIFATIHTNNYEEILERRLFNGLGTTYLINNQGEILIGAQEKNWNSNFYEYLKNNYQVKSKKELEKITNMSNQILNNKVGTFYISLKNQVHFIHYEKLNINNWYVVTLAPGSTIAKELSTFLSISLGLCFLQLIILFSIFIYIYLGKQKQNKQLYEMAYLDPITNLGNEYFFKEHSKEFLNQSPNHQYIMMIDINKFKHFNKIYEYEFCNEILKCFGQKLKNTLPKNSIVSRVSRDVFLAYFSYTGKIEHLMKTLFVALEDLKVYTIHIHINVAAGIYKITKKDIDMNDILDKVDTAHAKSKGPYDSNYYIFDEELENKMLEEQQIELNMESALQKQEFKIYYQPKVYVRNGSLAGAEALVRWEKDETLIPPNHFIPLFEKNKFIIKLDLYVFETVCKHMKEWREKWEHFPVISVNISKEHFTDENFIIKYAKIADKYSIPHEMIDLEITESATSDESINIVQIINNIKKQGFLISLDDFGVGSSSLGMLQQLNIDIIKIDKTFIDQANLKSDRNIINYIALMSQKLGVKTIVEGIEKKDQVEFIQKLKCDMIQGYYYSKPLPKKDFEEYLQENKYYKKGKK